MTDDERSALRLEVGALTKPMLHLRLYVITWTNRPDAAPDDLLAALPAHLRWQLELERTNVLFGSGPLHDDNGVPTGEGLSIVRAESAAAVHALVASEPFLARGLRSYSLRCWDLSEGTIALRVRFGSGGYEVG